MIPVTGMGADCPRTLPLVEAPGPSGAITPGDYDSVGLSNNTTAPYIRQYAAAHGVSIPCELTLIQDMTIMCSDDTQWAYETGNVLSIEVYAAGYTIHSQRGVTNRVSN